MKQIGLTDEQVRQSKEKFGDNSLGEIKGRGFLGKLLENFKDPMIKILCFALAINVVFAVIGQAEWYEAVGIALAVILSTFVSTFSEYRNENAFQKLQEDASRIMSKIYRNGVITEVAVDDIVVGDCILLQAGDKIPADGRMIQGDIRVDQAVLNGESKEAEKTAVSEDDSNTETTIDFLDASHVYRGTITTSGNGIMEVTVVGDQSVYGKIAEELQNEDERESPLKVKLANLAGTISKFGYIGGVAIAVAFIFRRIIIQNNFDIALIMAYCSNWMNVFNDVVSAVILAVIIIVMAVPEGLPLMIAIVSAQNMGKMLKDNVLVRKIGGIETAGSLNLLLSDKTGTITKGQLEVVSFVSGLGKAYQTSEEVEDGLKTKLALCIGHNSTSMVTGTGSEQRIIGGNGTERAVLEFLKGHFKSFDIEKVAEIPFNSTNKYSATQVSGEHNGTLIKGAPEKLLSKCKYCFNEQGEKIAFENPQMIEKKINELANRAIRVLGIAFSENHLQGENLPEGDWTLVGILGIRDEVRPESILALEEVHQAGIQVIMITGDRKDTAVAIAKEAGLLKKETDIVLTSDEMNQMSDDELKAVIKDLRVVARALPSDKSRLVNAAQELNLVVGMTGDGVNDSPALKKADVGFAMGSGTEVAKEASDIVILDDNFTSIDKAILYGRTIFNSIRKFIIFQLTINVVAVSVSFVAPLLGLANPLSITQILWVNLVMDTFAALAFGGEPALKRSMKELPKRRDEPILSKNMKSQILVGSTWIFIVSMFILTGHGTDGIFRKSLDNRYLLTGYFTFFILAAVCNAFNARTEKINLLDHINENKGFLKILSMIVMVQVIMTYFGGPILRCYGLTTKEWLFVVVAALTIIPVDIIRKVILLKK